jgi:prophage regulatory protein
MVVNSNSLRVIRMAELTEKVALQPSTIYSLVQSGKFPVPFKIAPGGRASGWLLSDIEDWIGCNLELNKEAIMNKVSNKNQLDAIDSLNRMASIKRSDPSTDAEISRLPCIHELLATELGLAGHQIQPLEGGYLVFRLNLVKYCASFEELLAFSKSMGVAK